MLVRRLKSATGYNLPLRILITKNQAVNPIAATTKIISPNILTDIQGVEWGVAAGGVGAASVWKPKVADHSLGSGSSAITRQK